jgi:hypothetical protein
VEVWGKHWNCKPEFKFRRGPEFKSRCNPGFFLSFRMRDKTGQGRARGFGSEHAVWRNKQSLHKRRSDVMPPTQIKIGLNLLLGAKSETNQVILPMIESSV